MYLENKVENKTYFMILFAIFVYGIIVNLIYTYTKYTKKIILDEHKISFGKSDYRWENVKEIMLTGKKSFGFFNSQIEATTITFEDNSRRYIFDDIFSNGWEIKSFIKNVIVDKNENKAPIENVILEKDIQKEIFYTYAGNPIFSFRGIMMWSLIIFFLYLGFSSGEKMSLSKKLYVFIPISLFWFLANAYSTDYFEVSKNYLVVKNHYFFWKKNIFRLTDIEEVVFETYSKQANILRVITKDFKRKLYRAGTLKDSTWLELKHDLEKKNIIVRNECI